MKIDNSSLNQTTVPLYTFAYIPEESIEKVEYILDDSEMLAQCTEIPYYYEATTQYLPEGEHTLTVRVTGSGSVMEQKYTIKRDGSVIDIIK